ncbi:MAG: KpsF/GutQ family sugar-phosphate isomerase [Bacteroidetes bacterium]|nr:MAG: KpsF/GutQ family sugar-phosphate isomerase [Bacteroidota bacterium]
MSLVRDLARQVFETESHAISRLSDLLTEEFDRAVECMLACKGRVVLSGVGKSGLIARKIAATLTSTGTPAFFLHPSEALHGDLGLLSPDDVFLSLSSSGETDELLRMSPYIQQLGVPHICIVGNVHSTLARHAQVVLDASVEAEACPLQLAPTASSTAALAMGDALAMTLMQLKGFRSEDFATFHPAGSLGRRLLMQVSQVMRTQDLPTLAPDTPVQQVIHCISAGRLGLAVVTVQGHITGIVTDGDVRRAMERRQEQFFTLLAADLMTPQPVCVAPELRLRDAEILMNQRKITSLLVAEAGKLTGILQIYDLGI